MNKNEPKDEMARPVVRRFAANFMAMLTSDVLNRGTTFLIYILVARQLGTFAFGQMSLALTLFYSFQVIATFGMQTLITREIAKDGKDSGKYFYNSLLIGLITSAASTLLLVAAVLLLNYPASTRDLILLTAVGVVPFTIGTICEAVIRGWEKMHLIAFVQIPINLIKVLATCFLLWTGGTIFQIMVVIVMARFLVGTALFVITVVQLRPWVSGFLDFDFAWSIVWRSTTFVGIDTVTAWWASLNIVLLSKFASENEVGLFSSAAQLMIPISIFYQSVLIAAFPIMCRRFGTAGGLRNVSNRLIELLLLLAIPSTAGLFVLAEPALELIYKKEGFVLAATVLRITVFILILKALTFALGHVLLAGNRERTTLRIVTVDLAVAFVLGWILIGYFGLIGAAVAALLTRIIDFAQHYGPVRELIAQIEIWRVTWKPLSASVAMAAFLVLVPCQNLGLAIVSGMVVYFVVLIGLETWLAGGVRNLRARYL